MDELTFFNWMKSTAPRVAFEVPNVLSGEGTIAVDMTFECMDDFTPHGVARKVAFLSKLVDAREQLSNLISYLDGKTGAEDLLTEVMNDASLLASLTGAANSKAKGD